MKNVKDTKSIAGTVKKKVYFDTSGHGDQETMNFRIGCGGGGVLMFVSIISYSTQRCGGGVFRDNNNEEKNGFGWSFCKSQPKQKP